MCAFFVDLRLFERLLAGLEIGARRILAVVIEEEIVELIFRS